MAADTASGRNRPGCERPHTFFGLRMARWWITKEREIWSRQHTFSKNDIHFFQRHAFGFRIHYSSTPTSNTAYKRKMGRTHGNILSQYRFRLTWLREGRLARLTKNKTTHAKKAVHKVQPPCYNFLKIRCRLANNPVESPVSGGGQRNALCAECERHDLILACE